MAWQIAPETVMEHSSNGTSPTLWIAQRTAVWENTGIRA